MRTHRTKIIGVSIGLVIVGLIVGGIVFLFGKKEMDFYRDKDMGEIKAVCISLDGTVNENVGNGCYWIYDRDVIEKLESELEKIELTVDYSGEEPVGEDGFNIKFLGDDEQIFSVMMTREQNRYFGHLGMTYSGVVEEGIKSMMGMVTMSGENGDRLYELIKNIMETQIHKMTPEEVSQLSEDEVYDWRRYQQYIYKDEPHDTIKMRDGMESVGVARFDIEGTEAYVMVWYCSAIVYANGEHTVYEEVIDAVVYDKNGDTINLYDENINSFLEDIE